MVDFSGEGGAIHFDEYEARELIHHGGSIAWGVTIHGRNKHEEITDNQNISSFDSSYLMSLRSCYLSARFGDLMIIEPYNPYRIGRQFGFFQDVPYDLEGSVPSASLDNILHHWRICTKTRTTSRVHLPARSLHLRDQVSQRYKRWWLAKHGNYFEDNVVKLVGSVMPTSSKPKLPKGNGGNHGGKQIHLPEEEPPAPKRAIQISGARKQDVREENI